MLHILNTRPPRPVILGFLSFVVRTGASLCLPMLYYAVASQSEGVVRTHTVAFRMLVDFVLRSTAKTSADSILQCRSASCASG